MINIIELKIELENLEKNLFTELSKMENTLVQMYKIDRNNKNEYGNLVDYFTKFLENKTEITAHEFNCIFLKINDFIHLDIIELYDPSVYRRKLKSLDFTNFKYEFLQFLQFEKTKALSTLISINNLENKKNELI